MQTSSSAVSIAKLIKSDTLPPVVICIGTDRVTGDALGPMVGEILTRELNAPFCVYGTLGYPITALNLTKTLKFIRDRHPLNTLIAVDSSLGECENIGKISVRRGGIKPGLGSGKTLPVTGDVSVTATVADLKVPDSIRDVRIGLIYPLARQLARDIFAAVTFATSTRK